MYTIYDKNFCPEAMINKFPHHAKYETDDRLYLFGETLEQITGVAAESIVNLSSMGLQEDDGTEEGVLTKTQLDNMVTAMLAEEPTGREVQLSKSQGRFLYETRFKPTEQDNQ